MDIETLNIRSSLSKPRTRPSIEACCPVDTSSWDPRRITMLKTIKRHSNILPQSSCHKQREDQDEDYIVLQWNLFTSRMAKGNKIEKCPSDTWCPPDTNAMKKRLRATITHLSEPSTHLHPGISRYFTCCHGQGIKKTYLMTHSAQMAFQAIINKTVPHISIRRSRVLRDSFAFSPPNQHTTK